MRFVDGKKSQRHVAQVFDELVFQQAAPATHIEQPIFAVPGPPHDVLLLRPRDLAVERMPPGYPFAPAGRPDPASAQ